MEALIGRGFAEDPAKDTADDIIVASSSTVARLTRAIHGKFKTVSDNALQIYPIYSGPGFKLFCETGASDIAMASRRIRVGEVAACKAISRKPIEFPVGIDAVMIVVNPANDFLTEVFVLSLAIAGCTSELPKGCPPRCVEVNLKRVTLTGVNLAGANLTGAILIDGQLSRTHLKGANLSGADLTGLFYNAWRAYCQSPTREANTGDLYQALEAIDRASKMLWSFNLPIQLPWADRLGVLSNGLIGKITDPLGQFSIRYGIGYCGRSLEVIEHNLLLNGRLSVVTVAAQFQPIPSSPYPRGSGYDNAEQTCR
ncbi:pentapeptide repeat-containing protein [Candidatus Poribacteria bacterium]|nr:pentapeptide repeat-containing protein [Candidatus Poribacteria bacterium]